MQNYSVFKIDYFFCLRENNNINVPALRFRVEHKFCMDGNIIYNSF